MVSIHLDIIKFLLIYRHLQNDYRFRRGTLLSPVPLFGAFELARFVETSNEDPTPYAYNFPSPFTTVVKGFVIAYAIPIGIYRCMVRDKSWKCSKFQRVRALRQ